jgi:hypothetical protein
MICAVQHYLDTVAFKSKVNVTSVKDNGKYDGFEICFEESQPAESNTAVELAQNTTRAGSN